MVSLKLHHTRSFIAAALIWILGCGTTASVRTLQPIEENLSPYKHAFVLVTATPHVRSQPGYQSAETALKFRTISKLNATKIFQDVTDRLPSEMTDSDLKIMITVTSLGTASERSWAGPHVGIGMGHVFSGGAFGIGMDTVLPAPAVGLIVRVELFNAKSDRMLGSIDSTATSGDLVAQAEAITDKFVAEITANRK
ncbi:MAG: hypothetical protein HY695_11490 [Deltaproteobacteria bacterium]|nr:hypothetical protein [Deltaproteobacteria bacterium]